MPSAPMSMRSKFRETVRCIGERERSWERKMRNGECSRARFRILSIGVRARHWEARSTERCATSMSWALSGQRVEASIILFVFIAERSSCLLGRQSLTNISLYIFLNKFFFLANQAVLRCLSYSLLDRTSPHFEERLVSFF